MARGSSKVLWMVLAALLTVVAVPVLLGRSGEKTVSEAAVSGPSAPTWPVTVNVPEDVGRLDTGIKDIHGRRAGATCATCHVEHDEPPYAERVEELKSFHREMPFKHSNVTCSTCHAQEDRSLLHLADGRRIEFAQVLELCSQCHGTQARDYRNGAHGGMNGYWDLTRGPRVRNNCIDCHNPHTPAWPQVQPAFRPRDRFLTPRHEESGKATGATHPREVEAHE